MRWYWFFGQQEFEVKSYGSYVAVISVFVICIATWMAYTSWNVEIGLFRNIVKTIGLYVGGIGGACIGVMYSGCLLAIHPDNKDGFWG